MGFVFFGGGGLGAEAQQYADLSIILCFYHLSEWQPVAKQADKPSIPGGFWGDGSVSYHD